LSMLKNVSVVSANTTTAMTSAASGPAAALPTSRARRDLAGGRVAGASGVAGEVCVVVTDQPQQFFRPQAVSLESSPATGLSVISWDPVSMNPEGFLLSLA